MKKRKVDIPELKKVGSFDVDIGACDMKTGRYNRVYLLYDGLIGCVRCFSRTGVLVKLIQLKDDEPRKYRDNYGSMTIAIHEGIDNDAMLAAKQVPELYAFPPGVLPLCISYLGVEYIYTTSVYHGLRIYDNEGVFIRGVEGYALSACVDRRGRIYVTVGESKVQLYSHDGTFIRGWKYGILEYLETRAMAIGDLLWLDLYNDVDEDHAQIHDEFGNELIKFGLRPPHANVDLNVKCVFNDTVLVCSCPLPRHLRESGYKINQYAINGMWLHQWSIGRESNIDFMAVTPDGSLLYTLDNTEHKIVVYDFCERPTKE
jgi:hypothetical protein